MKISLHRFHQALAAHALLYAQTVKSINAYADIEVEAGEGTALVYSGKFSPIHGAFGFGVDGELDTTTLQHIEDFFLPTERTSRIYLPMEAATSTDFLLNHGYSLEKIPVLQWERKLQTQAYTHEVKELSYSDLNSWAQVCSSCYTGSREADLVRTILSHIPQSKFFFSFEETKPVAAASYFFTQGFCFLQGAATHKDFRNKTHYKQLSQKRLESLAAQGADTIFIHPILGTGDKNSLLKIGFQEMSTLLCFEKK